MRSDGKSYRKFVEPPKDCLCRQADGANTDPTIHRSVAGSWPPFGEYWQYKTLNLAVKSFLDILRGERPVLVKHESALQHESEPDS